MSSRSLFDSGLQPERTELAWRRTALAIGIGSLLSLRVLPAAVGDPAWGAVWLAPGIVGLAFAVLLWVGARARHRRLTRALLADRPEDVPGSGLMLLLALFVIGCGALSAAFVLWLT